MWSYFVCYVFVSMFSWFHGKMKREDAEQLLEPREDGLFLVRESNNYPGDYTLCVCSEGKVEHYHIIYKDNKLTIDEEEFFENLNQLVEVLKHKRLLRTARLPFEKKTHLVINIFILFSLLRAYSNFLLTTVDYFLLLY